VFLLADFWTNPAHTEPLQAALMAGEFAIHIRTGDVYSVEGASPTIAHSPDRKASSSPKRRKGILGVGHHQLQW
jgi:hypothetical protein